MLVSCRNILTPIRIQKNQSCISELANMIDAESDVDETWKQD